MNFSVKHLRLYCKYGLLTKCEVKMVGYWPSSFLHVYGQRQKTPHVFSCPHAKLLLINTNLCSFFYFSCRISSWLHTSTSCPHTSPWNVTTPTPRNDATTSRSSASPWSPTISSSTSWSDATTRGDTTTSRSTTPWGPTRKDARSPWGRKSTTTNCWKILMKHGTLKRNYLIFP